MTAAAPKPTAKRPTGAKVGKYTLTQVLGQGGYGDVHLGVSRVGPKVAVKILNAKSARDEDSVARFKREADTARRLAHPSIVRIVDVGSSRGRHYIVMELVRGGSLRKLLDRGDAPAIEVLSVLTQVAQALAFAHAQGVVHRDVKPSNVILSDLDGRAALSDFGLARGEDYSRLTRAGALVGTLDYLAPERIRGDDATPASDLYSLGCVLVECLSGEPPFGRRGPLQVGMAHLGEQPPDPLAERAEMPRELSAAVLSALEKDPADRPLPATAYAKRVQHACASPAPT